MGNYITITDAENRLSAAIIRQIYDDDNNGTADTGPINQLIADAEGYIDAAVDAIYPGLLPFNPVPREVKRLTLDAVEYYAARRHPEVVRRDWEKLKRVLDNDLKELRIQNRTIGEKPPDPAANQGGAMVPGVGQGLVVPIFYGSTCKWGIY
jgi:phage gp36-like protein